MLFDTHAHLDHRNFEGERDAILAGLAPAGVTRILNVGCDLSSSLRSVAMAGKYPFVYAAVGSHPDDADGFSPATLAMYRQLAQDPKVCAIGEIGLDYHYPDGPGKVAQAKCFAAQLALARELHLPVILHIRDAMGDALEMLKQYPEVRGVFHCYSGSPELAQQLVKQGWYIGFTGVVTFHNARKAVETAQAIPLDRILLETDCPYMAPEPHRGKRNDSRLLPFTAQRLADLRGMSLETFAAQTTENAACCFGIDL